MFEVVAIAAVCVLVAIGLGYAIAAWWLRPEPADRLARPGASPSDRHA